MVRRAFYSAVAAAGFVVLVSAPACAFTYNWTWTCAPTQCDIEGNGTLETDTDLTLGPANVVAFNGIFQTFPIFGLSPVGTEGSDNVILALSPAQELTSYAGITFSTPLSVYNIYFEDFLSSGKDNLTNRGFGEFTVSAIPINPSEVPLPSTFMLFASGIGAFGLLARQRTRKKQVAA